jgi:hypothetical protein
MIIVEHRKNLTTDLKSVNKNHGVEIDLRLSHGELVLAHDPYSPGEKFSDWIQEFDHALLILNVKEEGLERSILRELNEKTLGKYFFLDQALPSIIESIRLEYSVAARISEFEKFTWTSEFAPSWIWIDCFSGNWDYLDQELERITKICLKTCLVSPELQGRFDPSEVQTLKSILNNHNYVPDAVCTKESIKWED